MAKLRIEIDYAPLKSGQRPGSRDITATVEDGGDRVSAHHLTVPPARDLRAVIDAMRAGATRDAAMRGVAVTDHEIVDRTNGAWDDNNDPVDIVLTDELRDDGVRVVSWELRRDGRPFRSVSDDGVRIGYQGGVAVAGDDAEPAYREAEEAGRRCAFAARCRVDRVYDLSGIVE